MLAKGAETLPNKVAHDYKALAKLYDSKNYKKGLKSSQKILQAHPDHPETNSMKALFELELGDEAKAEKTAKFALLKSMMKSMFCWHTYGSILKRRKNYIQAVKCFQQALKFEKDNMQILRQTATLQIQVRDHESHVNTRRKLLQLKSNQLYNWAAFAVAQHMVQILINLTQKGDFQELYKILGSIETMRISAEMKPVEISHYCLYRAIAYRDGGQFDTMHKQLHKNKDNIKDEDIWHQLMFKCCLQLGKQDEAEQSIQFLIKKFPQNSDYIRRYQKFKKLQSREVYQKLINDFGSKIAKVYELTVIADKEQFRKVFASFIKPYYTKNLISLFAQIQVVYEKTSHQSEIQTVFLEFQQSLKQNKYPDGSDAVFPTQYLWSLYLLAQHFSRKFQTLTKAYAYICKAIQHTNTVSQFYLVKADIQYKMHNNLASIKTINEARKTDLADRYMNNICIKYLMKCMKPHIAEDVLRLFMRDQSSLYELQNQWYIIQAGKSFLKMRKFEPGLRHLNFIEKQFIDMTANQYDFHTYCIRKWTLKQYVEYIAFNDNIYQNKKYMQAAAYAIENLFQFVEYSKNIPKVEQETQQEKANKKKKKKNKKTQQQQTEQLQPTEIFRKKVDYFGKEYIQNIKEDPIKQALIYAKNVLSARFINKGNLQENKLFGNAFAQAIRTFIYYKKPLMVIRAHKKLVKTNSDSFSRHLWTLKTIKFLKKTLQEDKQHQLVKSNVNQYLDEILGSKSIADYHLQKQNQFLETPVRNIKLSQCQMILNDKNSREQLIQLYKSQIEKIIDCRQKDIHTLQKTFYLVHRLEFYGEFQEHYKTALHEIFGQQTTYFSNWAEQIDKLPETTWGLFWLSDYDQKREEELMKQQEEKQKNRKSKQNEQKK